MTVLRLTPTLRRWLAIGAAFAVLLGLLRWGLGGSPGAGLGASGTGGGTSGTAAAGAAAGVTEPVIALTIDAGDGSLIAPLAQALAAANLPASIFVSAGYARAHAAALTTLAGNGDEIDVLADGSGSTLGQAADEVAAATGQAPLFARPATAGGAASAALLQAARTQGLAIAAAPAPATSAADILAHLVPGDVALLPVSLAPEIPALAAGLQSKGYQAVTIEALSAIAAGAAATSLPTVP